MHFSHSHRIWFELTFFSLVPDPNKATVEPQLRTIQVFVSKRMLLRRYIQVGSKRVYGSNESGKAVMLEHETPLQLHCRDRVVSLKRPPWYQICETMAKVFHIPQAHLQILTLILITSDGPIIEDILSCNDLWDEAVSDIDDVDEEEEPEEPEEDLNDQDDESVDNDEKQTQVDVDDDQSDDCLFVSERQGPASSSEPETPTMEEETCDDPEDPQTPLAEPRWAPSPRSSRAKPGISFKQRGPSLSEVRRANKAQREQQAVHAIATSANNYDLDEVKVYGPSLDQRNRSELLTGFVFGATDPLGEYPDQDDRIRYLGEIFVWGILTSHFAGCSDDVWTSSMRTRQNLGKLELEDLDGSSAFTVIDPDATAAILEWLDGRLQRDEDRGKDGECPETYHILVKATEGDVQEPFALSNEEAKLVCQTRSVPISMTNSFRRSSTGVQAIPTQSLSFGYTTSRTSHSSPCWKTHSH